MGSNPIRERELSAVGANPTSAAIYIDNATGHEVTEAWWPGDTLEQNNG